MWIRTFLLSNQGTLPRTFTVDQHFNRGDKTVIGFDASPYGFGAWIQVNGAVRPYISSTMSTTDCVDLGVDAKLLGEADVQQVSESFAILVALRHWFELWRSKRVSLIIRSDNLAALQAVIKLQPKSQHLARTVREIAMDVAESLHEPDICHHVPGVTNDSADFLSRPVRIKSEPVPAFFLLECDVTFLIIEVLFGGDFLFWNHNRDKCDVQIYPLRKVDAWAKIVMLLCFWYACLVLLMLPCCFLFATAAMCAPVRKTLITAMDYWLGLGGYLCWASFQFAVHDILTKDYLVLLRL